MHLFKKFLFLSPLVFVIHCTTYLVKEDGIKNLDKQFDGIYACTRDISVGNNDIIQAGTKVRLYFQSGTNSIKVYAYPMDDSREKTIGRNILYLFETDFPEARFNEKYLEKKLTEIVKKIG